MCIRINQSLAALGLVLSLVACCSEPALAQPAPQETDGHNIAKTPRPPQDVDGDPLPPGAVARLGTLRYRPEDGATSAVVSADGTKLVTVSAGRPSGVQVWNLADGRLLRQHNEAGYTDVALLPDGETMALASWEKGTRLVDLKTGKMKRQIDTPNPTECIAVSPDGRTLAAWKVDRGENAAEPTGGTTIVSLYDLATGKFRKRIERKHDMAVVGDIRRSMTSGPAPELEFWNIKFVAFSPDGKSVGAASWDKGITFWEPRSGEWAREFGGAKQPAFCFAVSADRNLLAAAHSDRTLRIYDLTTGKQLHRYPTGMQSVRSLAFAPGGKYLAVGGSVFEGDRWIPGDAVWEVATGKRICELGTWASSMAYTPDGKTLVVCDGMTHLFDPMTGKERRPQIGHQSEVVGLAFASDGKTLVSEGGDRTLRWWSMKTGKEVRQCEGYAGAGNSRLAFSPDGRLLAHRTDARVIHVRDARTGKEVRTLKGHQGVIYPVAFSADGKTLVSAERDGPTVVWDVATAKEIRRIANPFGGGETVALSADGRLLAVVKANNTAPSKGPHHFSIFDTIKGQEVASFAIVGPQAPATLAFTRGNESLIAGTYNGIVLVLDARTGKEHHRIAAHDFYVRSLAVSPDGKQLASGGGFKGRIRVCDVATGRRIHDFPSNGQRTNALAFSPDGTAGSDTTIVLWDVGKK